MSYLLEVDIKLHTLPTYLEMKKTKTHHFSAAEFEPRSRLQAQQMEFLERQSYPHQLLLLKINILTCN